LVLLKKKGKAAGKSETKGGKKVSRNMKVLKGAPRIRLLRSDGGKRKKRRNTSPVYLGKKGRAVEKTKKRGENAAQNSR